MTVSVDGDDVSSAAQFGEPDEECTTLASEGACVLEACTTPLHRFASFPHAGDIDVRSPDETMMRLVPSSLGSYSAESTFGTMPIPERFTFVAEGQHVPAFSVDVETPGPLFAVALPGPNPRTANADLEIAHDPFDAAFEVFMRQDIGPRVHCSFTGGTAVVPKGILGGLARDRLIRGAAARIASKRISAGDYTIDVSVVRDRKDFTLTLTPAEPSSGP